jgi:hypothetical protein
MHTDPTSRALTQGPGGTQLTITLADRTRSKTCHTHSMEHSQRNNAQERRIVSGTGPRVCARKKKDAYSK